jgi:Glycosyl hydrolase family 99
MNKKSRSFLLLWFLLISCTAFAKERKAFIYYYGWYGNPAYDLQWSHWQENQHQPPWDIASSFYPKLGAYSSRDPAVLELHMNWIAQANVHALIFSWWGKKDPTNDVAELVLNAAEKYNLKVAFLIEPYEGRTTRRICDDIEYLTETFGKHPAFLRISRQTTFGPNPADRGVFFIYDPDFSDQQMRALSDTVHRSNYDSILLFQSTDAALIERAHADGIFAYEAVIDIMHFYDGIQKAVEREGGLFVPCVVPGFNLKRYLGQPSPLLRKRKKGDTYDDWWEHTIASNPEFVAVLSFNEWHEGTQIEPAIRVSKIDPPYLSYEKTYDKNGVQAQFSYLRRTARWIKLFLQLP